MIQANIYAKPMDYEGEIPGIRIPYFYLDGLAEDKNQYDICNADIEAFSNALSKGLSLVNVIYTNSESHEALMFSRCGGMCMEGLIILLTDIPRLADTFSHYPTCMEQTELDYLRYKHPEVYKMCRG